MSEVVIHWITGTVEPPRPTGRWITDADGWSYEERTPWRYLDDEGRVVRTKPAEVWARIRFD